MSDERQFSDSKSENGDDNSSIDSTISSTDQQIDAFVEAINLDNFWNYFETAIKLKNEDNYNEASVILKALITKGSTIYNSELDISLAIVYFQLGNTFLEKLERDPDVVNQEAPKIVAPNEDHYFPQNQSNKIDNGAKINGKFEQSNKEQNKINQLDEEGIEEIQIAWENLDICRLIIEKYFLENANMNPEEKSVLELRLANCYLRLGDCENWKELFSVALEEYMKSLEILNRLNSPNTLRRIAELHFLIANTYLYEFKDLAFVNALEHYEMGKATLSRKIAELKLEVQTKAVEDMIMQLQEISRTFEEKIEEVKDELEMKDVVFLEKQKLQELVNNKNAGFAKSEFDEKTVEVKKLGKFGGNKADKHIPTESLVLEEKQTKKINENPEVESSPESKKFDEEKPKNITDSQ
jgi:hypothetical protein